MAKAKVKKKAVSKQGGRTLRDYLSHLSLRQAEILLGAGGKKLLMEGSKLEVASMEEVTLTVNEFVLDHAMTGAQVRIRLDDTAHQDRDRV